MKKNYLYSITALLMLLFTASCSQEEITSSANSKEGIVTLDVRVPVNTANSRSNVPTIPEGYKLRCILQPVDNEHNPVGDRLVEEVQAGQENITFTFETPEGYNGAMLWADYFKGDDKTADNLYVTTDLKCITYNASATATELFNNDAADAFYGYLMGTGTSIELQRPFTKLTFKASEDYADYTNITITDLPAPSGFNVMSGETTTASDITSNNLTISEGVWFSTYLFAGSNVSTLQGDITFTLSKKGESLNLKMPGKDIPLTRNNDVTATVTPGEDNTTDVTVTFPGGMTDPNKIALGDYINKNGTFSKTYDASKAIAIVFALAEGKSDNSDYSGKTAEAYAFALNNCVVKTKLSDAELTGGDTDFTVDLYVNGYGMASHDKFMNQCSSITSSSPILTAFTSWNESNATSSEQLSSWYIPTPAQVRDFSGLVLSGEGWELNNNGTAVAGLTFPTMDSKVFEAYTAARGSETYFNGKEDGSATNILTSVLNTNNKIATVQIDEAGKKLGARETPTTGTYSLRPVITVFEGIELAK